MSDTMPAWKQCACAVVALPILLFGLVLFLATATVVFCEFVFFKFLKQ